MDGNPWEIQDKRTDDQSAAQSQRLLIFNKCMAYMEKEPTNCIDQYQWTAAFQIQLIKHQIEQMHERFLEKSCDHYTL